MGGITNIIIAAGLGLLAGFAIGDTRATARAGLQHAAALAEAQAQVIRAAELASRKEAMRLSLEAERDALARDLEDQAHAQPAGGICLPAERVRRLGLR